MKWLKTDPLVIVPWVVALAVTALAPPTASAAPVDVVELTVKDIEAGLATGQFTSTDLVGAFMERIAGYEPYYNAFVSFNPDALATAAALDAEYAVSGPRSPLHGVPVVVKDNMDYAGLVTTNGYKGFSSAAGGIDAVPSRDASVVSRLQEAGAVIIGKTNLPDFARSGTLTDSSVAGRTHNSYGMGLVPGGSSGGTATAVSASFAVLGLGTETGGSIQNPSAAQSLVGIKPTYGLVPIDGIAPLTASRDVAGPMAKTVYDAAVTLDAIAGPTTADLRTYASIGHTPGVSYTNFLKTDALAGARVGLYEPIWGGQLSPEVASVYSEMVSIIEGLGASTVDKVFDDTAWASTYNASPSFVTHYYDYNVYLASLGESTPYHSVEEWEALTGLKMGAGAVPTPFVMTTRGSGADPIADETYYPYLAWRAQVLDLYQEIMADLNLNALFFPHAANALPGFGGDLSGIAVSEINHLGIPLITVPAGYLVDGQPFSITIIGRDRFTEQEILGYAYAFEQATLLRQAPTLVPEPSSAGLLSLGVIGLLLLARRQRTVWKAKRMGQAAVAA